MLGKLLSRLRRALNPGRVLRVTKIGRVYLLVTIGIGLGALNTGNNLLYLVLGLMLSSIVLSGILSERVIWDLEIRRLLPEGAFAGEPFALRYEVRRARGHGFALRIKEGGALETNGVWVPVVVAGTPLIVRAIATAGRRGPWSLGSIELATTFPFGIFEKVRVLDVRDELLVFPRRGFACDPPAISTVPQGNDSGTSRHRDGTADLADLRELEPGESARRIHWRKSAVLGKLVAVEREREERRQITLQVDPTQANDVLDRACEEAAGQTTQLMARGFDVGLEVGGFRVRPGHGTAHERRLLSALALAGFEEPRASNDTPGSRRVDAERGVR